MAWNLVVLWAVLALASAEPNSKYRRQLNHVHHPTDDESHLVLHFSDQARAWNPTAESMDASQQLAGTARAAGCQSGLPDLAWVRANAENLLFLEHLQKQAAEQNLYGWKSELSSQDYQVRLDQIRSGSAWECGASSCGGGCEDSMLLERIVALEERLASCGGITHDNPFDIEDRPQVIQTILGGCGGGMDCGGGCEIYSQRIIILQGELRRQRAMIQRLYQQITIISGSSSGCSQGKAISHSYSPSSDNYPTRDVYIIVTRRTSGFACRERKRPGWLF